MQAAGKRSASTEPATDTPHSTRRRRFADAAEQRMKGIKSSSLHPKVAHRMESSATQHRRRTTPSPTGDAGDRTRDQDLDNDCDPAPDHDAQRLLHQEQPSLPSAQASAVQLAPIDLAGFQVDASLNALPAEEGWGDSQSFSLPHQPVHSCE
jgi:hypothetical protein